jgi:hypothetical protein
VAVLAARCGQLTMSCGTLLCRATRRPVIIVR